MELLDLIRILRKYQWMIVLLVIITLAATYVANELITPIYQAEATVMVTQDRVSMTMFDMQTLGKDAVMDYVEVLKSRSMAEKVARLLYPSEEITTKFINGIRDRISVSIVPQTNVIKISATSDDPKDAQELANAYALVFIDDSRMVNQAEARAAREFIEEQLKLVSADLKAAEEALLAFKKEADTVSPTDETKAVLSQLTSLEAEKAEIGMALLETETKLQEAYRQLESQEETVLSSTTVTNNPVLAGIKQRLTDLELELSRALEKYTDRHPTVIALKSEIEEVKLKMEQEVEKIVGSETITTNPIRQSILSNIVVWETTKAALIARQDALGQVIAEVESKLTSLPEKELQLARLLREQSVAEKIYMILLENNEEIKIAEARETADIRLIDAAVYPEHYIKPRKKLNLAIAGVLAIMIGCGLAILIEYLDTTIKTAEDVEQILGLPVMGLIPNLETTARRKRKRKYHSRGLSLDQ